MARSRNPFAFTPLPVSILSCLVYVAILVSLLVVHHTVPAPPTDGVTEDWPGVNISTGWDDLKTLSEQRHPFNSKANLLARAWLVQRLEDIARVNGVHLGHETSTPHTGDISSSNADEDSEPAVLLDDRVSNVTFTTKAAAYQWLRYYESDNVMLYIRGSSDPPGRFWNDESAPEAGLALVSAHFDSVSTGYGATDDGMGVVSALQIVSHWLSTPVSSRRHGLLVLLNNEEEDGLYGSKAYTQHPIARHTTSFINLEGAGAGGRATLFRATDAAVTAAYARSPYPFGNVLSADGFKRGLVRSATDYSNFVDDLGMRGLDVAFMGPRSMYHTDWDDARHSSKANVWHMLSAALPAVQVLSDGEWDKGQAEQGVWFDIFGRGFALLGIRTFFALTVTLLAVGPVVLLLVQIILSRQQKYYPFSRKTYLNGEDDDEPIWLLGLRGFFRVPFTIAIATGAVVALVWLVIQINPYVLYSSPYVVWSMLLTAHVILSWLLLAIADTVRPSALSRLYALLWLYIVSWIALLGSAIGADRLQLAGTYPAIFYNLSTFLALLVSYLELFALPSKQHYAYHAAYGISRPSTAGRRPPSIIRPSSSRQNDSGEPTERTALLSPSSSGARPTFANYRRHSDDPTAPTEGEEQQQDSSSVLLSRKAYGEEQAWSSSLPVWTWVLQLLLLLPINLILLGQLGLFLTYALHQTPADGNDVLPIYLCFAVVATLLVLPIIPFLHRVVWHVPLALTLVFAATTVYALLAPPFTTNDRLKVFFAQNVDLDSGFNQVALIGVKGYIRPVVDELPSSRGKNVTCRTGPASGLCERWRARGELEGCTWEGLAPAVLKGHDGGENARSGSPSRRGSSGEADYAEWLDVKVERIPGGSSDDRDGAVALVTLKGRNTRSCRLDIPRLVAGGRRVASVTVLNACPGQVEAALRGGGASEALSRVGCARGTQEVGVDGGQSDAVVSLLSRQFDETFRVLLRFGGVGGGDAARSPPASGRASCMWADASVQGAMPALQEATGFAPLWAAVTKNGEGLVEGGKAFSM